MFKKTVSCLLIFLITNISIVIPPLSFIQSANAIVVASKKIVFSSSRTGNNDIFVMNDDGSNQMQLTDNLASDQNPALSPDGTKIVFQTNRDGNNEIYIMDVDGSNQTNITNDSYDEQRPAFSPDGSKIIFQSNQSGGINNIFVMDADGSNPIQLTDDSSGAARGVYSPDGSKITFQSARDGNQEIYIMNADGSSQLRLTSDPTTDRGPFFSSDGTKIIWTAQRDGNPEIYEMNTDGSNQTNLTNNPANDGNPVYSFDGEKIAFQSNRDGNNEIYTMDPDGSNQINLTNNQANDITPDWGPAEPPNQAPILDSIGNKTVDEGSLLSFNVNATDPDAGDSLVYSATGLPSGASIDPATGAVSWTPGYDQAGSYPVTFTVDDGKGGTDSEDITIDVNDVPQNVAPNANFTYSPFNPATFDSVHFTDSSTDSDGNVASWLWDFGDGIFSTEQNPVHQYAVNGTYNVKLTVTDNDGAQSTFNSTVDISLPADDGTESVVTDGADQIRPDVYYSSVVWQDNRNGNWDIYEYSKDANAEYQQTNNNADQIAPVKNHNYLAWQDNRNGNWDIYIYDYTTQTERQLTTNTADQIAPAIDKKFDINQNIFGNKIVWQDNRNGNWDIYMYDFSTNTERQITTDPSDQTAPSIYDNFIVWQDNRNGNSDIYMYNLSTNTESQVTTDTSEQRNPGVYHERSPLGDPNGIRIVWQDNRNGNWDIYMYNLYSDVGYDANTEYQITTDSYDQVTPSIYKYRIVWKDKRGGNGDIYMYNIHSKTEWQLTTNNSEQSFPAIWGDTDFYNIAWQDNRNGNWNIYRKQIDNDFPIADTGGPYSVDFGSNLFLDASGSLNSDPGFGDLIFKYNWFINTSDSNWWSSDGYFGRTTAVSFISWHKLNSFGISAAGTYPVKLMVSDTFGGESWTDTTITVNDNVGPVDTITSPEEGDIVSGTIDINATVDDTLTGNSNISEATYSVDGGAPVALNPVDGALDSPFENVAAQLDTNTLTNGVHSISVIGKDLPDNMGNLATVSIFVNNNNPPVAVAGGPYVGSEGSSVTFDASNSYDQDGDSLKYRWDFDNNGTWDTQWQDVPTSNHTWTDDFNGIAKLEVSDGEASSFDSVSVAINNVAPAVTAMDDTSALWGSSVAFSGSFTDPGDDTYTYLWDFGDGTTSIELNTTHTYSNPGLYCATLTVTDDDGGVGIDTAGITVLKNVTAISISATGGQYSDEGNASAVLTNEGSPLVGKTVNFSLDGQSVGSAVTNENGNAVLSFVLDRPAADYQISADFDGDDYYNNSTAENNLTVQKEQSTLSYTGDYLTGYSQTTNLSASIIEEQDNLPGDIKKASPVEFILINDEGVIRTVTADTEQLSPGVGTVAATISELPTDVYKVTVKLADNSYYTANEIQTVLVVYNPLGGFVTGGGWIMQGNQKANFGFNAKYQNNGDLQGEFTMIDRSSGASVQIKSTSLDWLVVRSETSASFAGKVQFGNQGIYDFRVDITDNGNPGTNDIYKLTLSNGYTASGTLAGGNIVIH